MAASPDSPAAPDDGDDVGRRTFSTSFRGFDQGEVRSYLEVLAKEFTALKARIASLEGELDETRRPAQKPSVDIASLTAALGEETANVLRVAKTTAEEIRIRAEEGAARTLKEAHDEAARVRASAESVLAERSAEAEQTAARIRAAAEEEAARLRRVAETESQSKINQAIATGKDMVGQAQAARERVLADLSRRRNVALHQLDALRTGRERLLSSFVGARSEIDRLLDDLAQADNEARRAAEAVSRPKAAAAPGKEAKEAADAKEAAPATQPVEGKDEAEGTETTEARGGAGAKQAAEARHGEQGQGAAEGTPPTQALAGSEAAAPAATATTDHPTPEADAVEAGRPAPPVSATAPSATADGAAASPAAPDEAAASASGAAPDAGGPAEVAMGEGGGAGPANGTAGPAAGAVADTDVVPANMGDATEDVRADAPPTTAVAAQGGGAPPATEGGADDARADGAGGEAATVVADLTALERAPYPHDPVPAAVFTGPAVGGPPRGGRVDALFARIRADRRPARDNGPATKEASTKPGATTTDVEEAAEPPSLEAPHGDTDEAYLQQRDALAENAHANAVKFLKRALADDQNAALEHLRTARTDTMNLTGVLDEEDAQVRTWVRRVMPALLDAMAAGARLADGNPPADLAPVAVVAQRLASELVQPLRQRVDAVLETSGGDRSGPTVDRLNAVFREARGRIERTSGDAITEAISLGFVAALEPGANVRWVVEDVDGPCPDCDDNALAGALTVGEEFPTGQTAPPAHSGCRCILMRTTT